MLAKGTDRIPNGASVDVFDRDGRFIGVGIYSDRSLIAVRLLGSSAGRLIDTEFLAERFKFTRDLRESTLGILKTSNAYRLVNSEGDGLSGLILDRFNDSFVADIRAYGWWCRRNEISVALQKVFGEGTKLSFTTAQGIERTEGFTLEPYKDELVDFEEHGLRYRFRLAESHKTGFFLDQRDNRALLSTLCAGKKVLDCCCYTGGFTLNAIRGGASEAIGVDLDEDAIEAAKKNAGRNNLKAKFVQSDVFPYMRDRIRSGNTPDIIVLDPPKLIKSKDEFEEGLKMYLDLNRTALSTLASGGMLFTFSCSGLLDEASFLKVVSEAAFVSGKSFQVLKIVGAAPDHPYLLNAPETRYLKGVLGRVL